MKKVISISFDVEDYEDEQTVVNFIKKDKIADNMACALIDVSSFLRNIWKYEDLDGKDINFLMDYIYERFHSILHEHDVDL